MPNCNDILLWIRWLVYHIGLIGPVNQIISRLVKIAVVTLVVKSPYKLREDPLTNL
jgi:hypothetical protein